MSDGAWEKIPQYVFKIFFTCGTDPNDRKVSIQPFIKFFESLYPTPSERGNVQTTVQYVEMQNPMYYILSWLLSVIIIVEISITFVVLAPNMSFFVCWVSSFFSRCQFLIGTFLSKKFKCGVFESPQPTSTFSMGCITLIKNWYLN